MNYIYVENFVSANIQKVFVLDQAGSHQFVTKCHEFKQM